MASIRHPLVEAALEEVSAIYKKHGLNAISIIQSPDITDDTYPQTSFHIHLENSDPDVVVKMGPGIGIKSPKEFAGTLEAFAKKCVAVYRQFALMGAATRQLSSHIKGVLISLAPSIDPDVEISKLLTSANENNEKKSRQN